MKDSVIMTRIGKRIYEFVSGTIQDMKDAIDLIRQFKPIGITRDIHYVGTGIFFLLVLDFIFRPGSNLYSHWSELANIYKLGIVGIVGYFFARFCYEIGIMIHRLVWLCLVKNKKSKLKETWKDFMNYINNVSVELIPTQTVNHGELEEFISDTKSSSIFYERKIQAIMTESMFLGFSVLLSIFYSLYMLLAVIALLFISMISSIELAQLRIDMASFLTKKSQNSKKSIG